MRELDPEVLAIIADIRAAFQGVCPGQLSLHQAAAVKYADDVRLAELRLLDVDKHWTELSDASLESCATALYGADPESWRYFIPAFMTWTLRNLKTSNAFLCDQTIYTFVPSENRSELLDHNLQRYLLLSPAQCKAVCRFLMYMAQNGDFADDVTANRALANYWFQRCSGIKF